MMLTHFFPAFQINFKEKWGKEFPISPGLPSGGMGP
jgi:hypothetical protein